MNFKNSLLRISLVFSGIVLIFSLSAAAQAQRLTPLVCLEPNLQSGTLTLAQNASTGQTSITLTSALLYEKARLIINPGGANQETIAFAQAAPSSFLVYNLRSGALVNDHSAGETVQWFAGNKAVFGYHNTTESNITIPRSFSTFNFFYPGPSSYPGQPSQFLPGIHGRVFWIDVVEGENLHWVLDRLFATFDGNTPTCSVVTYQGRLTDSGASGNGQYDLKFTPYDALTGGKAQNDSLVIEDVAVTNGIFTVHLNFGAALLNNKNARFLEIAVRPGAATGSDPFTTLTPRQPLTSVPNATNAMTAEKAYDVQLILTTGIPSTNLCTAGAVNQYGQMRFDANANKLYICTATGWKSTVLQ